MRKSGESNTLAEIKNALTTLKDNVSKLPDTEETRSILHFVSRVQYPYTI